MTSYSKELNTAKEAANKAADLIRSYQQKRSFDVDFKGKNDLVTSADVQAERTIINCIKKSFPRDKIIGEETEHNQADMADRSWIIDPIDGTTNFVHGFPVYCVSVAFWEAGDVRTGVVLEVNSGECFYAVKDRGAFLNGDEIQASSLNEPQNALIGTGFPYNKKSFSGSYLEVFEYLLHNAQSVRRPGSAAYDLCCVASGRYDGFYEHSLKPWDVAAGALIVQEAGGKISDWHGGDDWLHGEQIAAGNEAINSFLLKAIQKFYDFG